MREILDPQFEGSSEPSFSITARNYHRLPRSFHHLSVADRFVISLGSRVAARKGLDTITLVSPRPARRIDCNPRRRVRRRIPLELVTSKTVQPLNGEINLTG